MGEGKENGKLSKVLLVVFNFVFAVSGVFILGVGIWLLVDPAVVEVQDVVNSDKENGNLEMSAFIMMGSGAIILMVAVFGCCGGIQASRFLLAMYILCLFLIFAAEVAAAVLAILYRKQVQNNLEENLLHALRKEYRPGADNYTQPWDLIQLKFNCCGVYNHSDFRDISLGEEMNVPMSCCVLNNTDFKNPIPKDGDMCQFEALQNTTKNLDYLHSQGCLDGVQRAMDDDKWIVIGIVLGVLAIEIIGIVLACNVCNNIKRNEYDKA